MKDDTSGDLRIASKSESSDQGRGRGESSDRGCGRDESSDRECGRDNSLGRRYGREKVYDGGQREDGIGQGKLESIFRALSSRNRRYILYELQDEEVSDLDSLAACVVAKRENISTDEISDDEVDRTKIHLVHEDIPQLEDAGFVEYDHRSRAVRYSNPSELLDAFLHLSAYVDDPPTQSR